MSKFKDNFLLIPYLIILAVCLPLPYLDYGQDYLVMVKSEPIAYIPLFFLGVLTISLFLVKNNKTNYFLVSVWLVITGLGTLIAYSDFEYGFDYELNYFNSATFWFMFLFPVSIGHWAIQRFKKP